MPGGKEPHRGGEDSLGHDTRGGLQRMNRRGLWAAGVVLLVGVGVLVVGTGFAKDENANDKNAAGARCSEATLHGRYLFAYDGVEGKKQLPLAVAGQQVFNGLRHV
jgi:hypothetical protein